MQAELKIWKTNRQLLAGYFKSYNLEQLNTIPSGFNNNLIWNIGHILVVQKMLVYGLSGLDLSLPEGMASRFKRGTRPGDTVTAGEAAHFRELLPGTVDQLIRDLDAGIFKTFTPFENSFGFQIGSLEEAVAFNNYHEGLHMGYMMSIRKFL